MKCTKGVWFVEGNEVYSTEPMPNGAADTMICKVEPNEQSIDNALLIAQAPDMLASLMDLLDPNIPFDRAAAVAAQVIERAQRYEYMTAPTPTEQINARNPMARNRD